MTPRLGTDGTRIVYPVRGIVQGARDSRTSSAGVERCLRHGPDRCCALATAVALVLAGYTLESPATVARARRRRGSRRANQRPVHGGEARADVDRRTVTPSASDAVRGGSFRATGRSGRRGGLDAWRSRTHRTTRSRPRTAAEVGHLHEHPIHDRCRNGACCAAALAHVPSEFGGLVVASLVGAVLGEALDVLFAALTARVRGRPIRDVMRTFVPVVLTSAPVYAPVVALLAFMYIRFSPWTLALFLVPAMAAQRLYGLYQEQRQLAVDLSTANETLERANLQFAAALDRNARRARPVHGRPFGGCRDLLTRYRGAHGPCRRSVRSGVPVRTRS